MIDEIVSVIRYDQYYSKCHPNYCSYSYTHRFDILFIITTLIGVFGGVTLVLKLTAPLFAIIILSRKTRVQFNNHETSRTSIDQNKGRLKILV
jgi:hypothetical protein